MTCLQNIPGISVNNHFIGFKSMSAVMAECIRLYCAYFQLQNSCFFHPKEPVLLKTMAAVTDCETVLSVKEMNRSSKPLAF